jgi:SOS response regulatory protein OraA/RecX
MDEVSRSARQCAIKYIGISNKSSGKVREYLLQKGYSPDVSVQTVNALIEDGYISDIKVAASILRSRSGKKTEGKSLLLRRLIQAGIPESIAKEALSNNTDDRESIMVYIQTNIIPTFSDDLLTDRMQFAKWYRKSMRNLISKGFSAELSADSLRKNIRDVE